MATNSWLTINGLREAESLEERRRILSKLTKEEKQALFGELYFERGVEFNVSFYDGYTTKNLQVVRNAQYSLACAYVRRLNAIRVLEVGCATGAFVKALRKLRAEAYGVDLSPYALSKADADVRGFLCNVDIETETLPFSDEFFDMIVAIETIEHLANITYALENLKRVLKATGSMLITVPKPRPQAFRDITHVNLWTEDQWIKVFSNGDFSYTPLNVNYREILKVHADLLSTLDFGGGVKGMLIKLLGRHCLGKSILYIHLLMRHRLRKALRVLTDLDHVFLFKK